MTQGQLGQKDNQSTFIATRKQKFILSSFLISLIPNHYQYKRMNNRTMRFVIFITLLSFSFAYAELSQIQTSLSTESSAHVQNAEVSKSKPSPKPSPKPNSNPNSRPGGSSKSSSFLSGFLGFIIGPILFFSAFPCIFYNERRAAIQTRRINLAKTISEEVDPTNHAQAQTKNGKLVYAKGQTKTNASIKDEICGVGGNNLIKITRVVQVLQWRKQTKKDGQQVYYQSEWVTCNSTTEGERYNNPQNWFLQNETTYNQNVYIGGYNINKEVCELCDKTIPFVPSRENIETIKNNCNITDKNGSITGQYIYFTPIIGGNVYTPPPFDNYSVPGSKQNDNGQTVGTLRVKFLLCPTGPMSLLAKSSVETNNGTFSSFNIAEYEGTHQQASEIPQGSICCIFCNVYRQFLIPLEEILVVQQKICTQQDLFAQLVQHSRKFTLIFRILAYASMVLGICLFFSPITTILGYIPLVGGFVSGIAGFAIFIGAVIICIPLFAIALSLAWLVYHPKIGLVILSAALLIFGYIWMNGKPPIPQTDPTT